MSIPEHRTRLHVVLDKEDLKDLRVIAARKGFRVNAIHEEAVRDYIIRNKDLLGTEPACASSEAGSAPSGQALA